MIEGGYEQFLIELQQQPGIEVVLNSGKSVAYLETNAARINGRYVIACNGAACQLLGSDTIVFGGGGEDLLRMPFV